MKKNKKPEKAFEEEFAWRAKNYQKMIEMNTR
jgi:hypothetical protein